MTVRELVEKLRVNTKVEIRVNNFKVICVEKDNIDMVRGDLLSKEVGNWGIDNTGRLLGTMDKIFVDILKESEQMSSDGWIDKELEVPSTNRYILLSFSNFSVPQIGRYEEDEEGGAFYIGDDTGTCVSQDLFVNAWMELPEPYKD